MRDPKLNINLTFTAATITEADTIYKAVKKKLETYPNVVISAVITGEPVEPA